MSDLSIRSALEEALQEVLERMFFVTAAPCDAAGSKAGSPTLHSTITFEGDPPGSLDLRVAVPAARSISSDFLGVDPEELSPCQIAEVICELTNMICGAVLSRVESSATFRLGAPILLPIEMPTGDSDITTMCSIETGSGSITAILKTERPTCPAAEKSVF